ncbi:MAG: BTAD domain-containing putative transcriptional regulator [Pseudomonadota bacterium]
MGGFEARLPDGSSLDIPTKKAQCLLAYLALQSGKAQPRERLVALFWGEMEEKRAQQSLRQALTYLRKSLSPLDPSPLSVDRNTVRLLTDSLKVDVVEFLKLTATGTSDELAAAVALYKGDLLEGVRIKEAEFERWLDAERHHLHAAYCHGLLALVVMKRQSGDLAEALQLAQRLLDIDPLQERVHRMLMGLYADMGMREAALKQFERCRSILAEELGVEPESETLSLYDFLRSSVRMHSNDQRGSEPEQDENNEPPTPPTPDLGRSRQTWGLSAIGLSLLVAIALLAWFRPWSPEVEPASLDRMAFPLPDSPSIAVLPFDNINDDPEQDYFADGITDDLITDLSKIPGLFVIARNSTFYYKGEGVPIRQVAEELGVRYILEGSVRRSGEEIRINAQLIDATTGGHLWAERYDGTLTDVLGFQDQVTRQVVSALEIELKTAEDAQFDGQETDSPEAYDALLHAREHIRNYTKEDFAIAISFLEKAIRLDREYALAHTLLGGTWWEIANDGWVRNFGLTYEEALEKARHHLRLGMKAPSSEVHFFRSKMHSNEGRYDEAITEARIVVALNPNNVNGYEALGRALNKAGRAAEAIEPLQNAARLNPRGDEKGWLLYRLGESFYLSERYDEAAEAFEASVARNHSEWTYLFLAASLAQLDMREAAAAALANFDRIYAESGEDPFTVSRVEHWAFKEQADRQRVQEGLRKAGVPEGAKTEQNLNYAQDVTPMNVDGATTVDAEQAKTLLEQGIKLVDVRDLADWRHGYIPGTLHLSLFRDFTDAKLSAVAERDEAVLVFGSGIGANKMAAIAAARAISWGFEKVYYFRDGIPGWKAAGYPIQVPPK